MSFASSWSAFRQVWREDRELARLGPSRGCLLSLHYRGRVEARLGRAAKVVSLRFWHFSRPLELRLSSPYLGAFKGVFLDVEYDGTGLFESPPRRILDLGANIGMGSLSLACQFPVAEFLCVEPDPRNLALLETNLHVNLLDAEIVAAAVGAAPGKLKLRFDVDPTCSALETSPMHDLSNATEVQVMTVPDLLAKKGWETVDLVKIDIEGTEEQLLSSHNEWLTRAGAILLEIHPNTTPEAIASYLAPFGFHLERIGHGREPVYFASRNPSRGKE